jgi:hypothetical protein
MRDQRPQQAGGRIVDVEDVMFLLGVAGIAYGVFKLWGPAVASLVVGAILLIVALDIVRAQRPPKRPEVDRARDR